MDTHQQREKHAGKYRHQREKEILDADYFVVETEDIFSKETLRRCVRVGFVSRHFITSPPLVPPAID